MIKVILSESLITVPKDLVQSATDWVVACWLYYRKIKNKQQLNKFKSYYDYYFQLLNEEDKQQLLQIKNNERNNISKRFTLEGYPIIDYFTISCCKYKQGEKFHLTYRENNIIKLANVFYNSKNEISVYLINFYKKEYYNAIRHELIHIIQSLYTKYSRASTEAGMPIKKDPTGKGFDFEYSDRHSSRYIEFYTNLYELSEDIKLILKNKLNRKLIPSSIQELNKYIYNKIVKHESFRGIKDKGIETNQSSLYQKALKVIIKDIIDSEEYQNIIKAINND